MAKQALAPRERLRLVASDDVAAAPTDGVTLPHLTLSPRAPNGDPCVGFSFALFAPGAGAAVAAAPGFTVQVYRLIPTLAKWSSFAAYDSYSYAEQLFCYDVGAGAALFFRIFNVTTPGNILVGVASLA